jgi:hypothetical protein
MSDATPTSALSTSNSPHGYIQWNFWILAATILLLGVTVLVQAITGHTVAVQDDAERSGLPSTDCLENFPNGGGCITYPKPMVVSLDDGKPAEGP